jgi:integrase
VSNRPGHRSERSARLRRFLGVIALTCAVRSLCDRSTSSREPLENCAQLEDVQKAAGHRDEFLTAAEVEALIEAAKGNRHGHRDATMILMAFRHGLRAAELVALEWSQVDFTAAVLHVRRVKKGTPATHPLRGEEMRALRKLQRESAASPFVFTSERGGRDDRHRPRHRGHRRGRQRGGHLALGRPAKDSAEMEKWNAAGEFKPEPVTFVDPRLIRCSRS